LCQFVIEHKKDFAQMTSLKFKLFDLISKPLL
jgi:hypothetical protein